MSYTYSLVGAESFTFLTGSEIVFNNIIQKFSSIFEGNETEEILYQDKYTDIEIPVFILDGYSTIKPIKITIEYLSDDEYIAAFEEGGVAFSANSVLEAIQEFKIEFIEVYKCLKAETCLGSWPKRQLAILESYIGKKK